MSGSIYQFTKSELQHIGTDHYDVRSTLDTAMSDTGSSGAKSDASSQNIDDRWDNLRRKLLDGDAKFEKDADNRDDDVPGPTRASYESPKTGTARKEASIKQQANRNYTAKKIDVRSGGTNVAKAADNRRTPSRTSSFMRKIDKEDGDEKKQDSPFKGASSPHERGRWGKENVKTGTLGRPLPSRTVRSSMVKKKVPREVIVATENNIETLMKNGTTKRNITTNTTQNGGKGQSHTDSSARNIPNVLSDITCELDEDGCAGYVGADIGEILTSYFKASKGNTAGGRVQPLLTALGGSQSMDQRVRGDAEDYNAKSPKLKRSPEAMTNPIAKISLVNTDRYTGKAAELKIGTSSKPATSPESPLKPNTLKPKGLPSADETTVADVSTTSATVTSGAENVKCDKIAPLLRTYPRPPVQNSNGGDKQSSSTDSSYSARLRKDPNTDLTTEGDKCKSSIPKPTVSTEGARVATANKRGNIPTPDSARLRKALTTGLANLRDPDKSSIKRVTHVPAVGGKVISIASCSSDPLNYAVRLQKLPTSGNTGKLDKEEIAKGQGLTASSGGDSTMGVNKRDVRTDDSQCAVAVKGENAPAQDITENASTISKPLNGQSVEKSSITHSSVHSKSDGSSLSSQKLHDGNADAGSEGSNSCSGIGKPDNSHIKAIEVLSEAAKPSASKVNAVFVVDGKKDALAKSSAIIESTEFFTGCIAGGRLDEEFAMFPEEQYVPSWRIEPSKSMSDWTIEVEYQHAGSMIVDVYHVHKHMIAVGKRKSEYMENVLRNEETARCTKKSRLKMEKASAKLFPFLLDFMYSEGTDIDVTTTNAVPLRNLANQLKVLALLPKVAEFLLKDMSKSNLTNYVNQARIYQDNEILKLAAEKCAKEFMAIEISHHLWAVMEPELFLRIITSVSSAATGSSHLTTSRYLSILIAEYHNLHKYEIDEEMFLRLTSDAILPVIDHTSALRLLEVIEDYESRNKFSCLQNRCTAAMACSWKMIRAVDRRRLFTLFGNSSSSFAVDFLELVETGRSATLVNALNLSKKVSSEMSASGSDYPVTNIDSITSTNLIDDLDCKTVTSCEGSTASALSWRMDPKTSFSDWTIIVKHLKYGEGDTYNVHKHILAVGPRKSQFFAELFKSESCAEVQTNTFPIQLGYGTAALLPQVLDFMYSPSDELQIHPETAVTLRFLARCFGIWKLNVKILDFVNSNISLCNVATYVTDSKALKDDKIIEIASGYCAEHIDEIDTDSDLIHQLDISFLLRIVSSSHLDKQHVSCHLSRLIAEFFKVHDMDESIFENILREAQLRIIDGKSALSLLQALEELENKELEPFKDLRERCTRVLSDNWHDFRENNREEMFQIFQKLDSKLVSDLFDKVENFYYGRHYQTMSMQSKLVKRYRSQLAAETKRRIDEVEDINVRMTAQIEELMANQKALEAQLRIANDASNRRVLRSSAYGGGSVRSRSTSRPRAGRDGPLLRSSTMFSTSSQKSRSFF